MCGPVEAVAAGACHCWPLFRVLQRAVVWLGTSSIYQILLPGLCSAVRAEKHKLDLVAVAYASIALAEVLLFTCDIELGGMSKSAVAMYESSLTKGTCTAHSNLDLEEQ